jgi:uncharacterized Rossmann fold enzyme
MEVGMKPIVDLDQTNIDDLRVETRYCVNKDVHNLHILKSVAAGYPPIPVVKQGETKSESIAIVCSGPSLGNTWEQVKMCHHVLTCSGAHDYMIERGIIPHFHMETDPRPHKAVFTKNPDKRTTYLIASSCHPDVFANLTGMDVRIWHVVPENELHRMPRGHWMITGGCNVGLRAMVMARLMGYVDVHVFGMDCSSGAVTWGEEGDSSRFHVNFHPNEPKKKGHRIVKVAGREFYTSDVFLECCRQFFKETMLLSDVRVTLHGDGLLQAVATQKMADPTEIEKRKKFIEKRGNITIALSLPKTISQPYVELNKQLHEANWDYGGHGDKYAKIVLKLKESQKLKSILDYGCGKGSLAAALDFPIWEYDPCIPGKEAPPRPAEFVVCTDVLEHIEPDNLQATLEDLKRVTLATAFFSIHSGPAKKVLPDGRNAHLIQQDINWWKTQLSTYFEIAFASTVKDTPWIYIVATRKIVQQQKAA